MEIISKLSKSSLGLIVVSTSIILLPLLIALLRYKGSIKKRLTEIENGWTDYRIHRIITPNQGQKKIRCLELDQNFLERNKDWKLISLGQYLSQLKPGNEDTPEFLKKELSLVIGSTLIKVLGKTYGAALLPVLGIGPLETSLGNVASNIASWVTAKIMADKSEQDPLEDIGGLNLTLLEVIAMLNAHQANRTWDMKETPLDLYCRGEKDQGNLSFDRSHLENNNEYKNEGLPNPFVMEKDFGQMIQDMEGIMKNINGTYDPDDKNSLAKPTLIDERFLPDLYFGWGDAQCTHTNDECLKNRLFALLLTKLGYNTYLLSKGAKSNDLFTVEYNGKSIHQPHQLIEEMLDSNHVVEVCPKSTFAQFGVALCVKEEDGSFTNIPLSLQQKTGVESPVDTRPTYFPAPHGGLDVVISGPLVGDGKRCNLQFYVDISGLTAVYANHDVDVPWLERTELAKPYNRQDSLQAVRMTGLVSTVFNSMASDMKLPFGGYGLLGMCNDAAALIDFAVRGETSCYPLLSTGKYLMHIVAYFEELKSKLNEIEGTVAIVNDIDKLINAAANMPTDLHITPSSVSCTASRYLATYDKAVFQLTTESIEIMKETVERYKKYA